MKILVTGASGFLGSHLVNELVKNNHQVTAFLYDDTWHPLLDGLKIRQAQGDILNIRSLEQAIKGHDVVMHAAGLVSFARNMKKKLYEVNVQGTRNVMMASVKNHVRRVVHVSSVAAVGARYDRQLMDEDTVYNVENLDIPYFDSKVMSEQEAMKGIKCGMDVVIVNPAIIVGPYDMISNASKTIQHAAKSRPLFLLRGGGDFVGVNDVLDGMIKAMQHGRCGERYILGSENLGFDEFTQRICNLIGRKAPKHYIAPWVIDVSSHLLRLLETLGYQGPISSYTLRRTSHLFTFHSLEKAKKELGYNPSPIDQAIYDSIEWMQTVGQLPEVKSIMPNNGS